LRETCKNVHEIFLAEYYIFNEKFIWRSKHLLFWGGQALAD